MSSDPFNPQDNPPLGAYDPTIPISFGDIFTKEDFEQCVEQGAFIDYDGFGHPSDGHRQDERFTIIPSRYKTDFPPTATHICWYNR